MLLLNQNIFSFFSNFGGDISTWISQWCLQIDIFQTKCSLPQSCFSFSDSYLYMLPSNVPIPSVVVYSKVISPFFLINKAFFGLDTNVLSQKTVFTKLPHSTVWPRDINRIAGWQVDKSLLKEVNLAGLCSAFCPSSFSCLE